MTFILGFCKTDGDLAAQQKPWKLPLPLPLALLGLDQVHHLKTPTRDQVKQVPKVIVSELSLLVRYLKIDADEKTVPNKVIFFYGSEPFSLAKAIAHTVLGLSLGELMTFWNLFTPRMLHFTRSWANQQSIKYQPTNLSWNFFFHR